MTARTLHSTLADVARESVRADERIATEMLAEGVIPSAASTSLTTRMRDALAAYDAASAAAANTPLRALIVQAHEALEAGNATRVSACLTSMLLILDFDAERGPYAPEAARVQ